jgi:cbb3-type cytochrome oxidase subunit 1
MPRVSLAFFTVGALCAVVGMSWGSYMGAVQDFTLAAAHAHLNLLGWVTLALMGTFYALRPQVAGRLAWLNFALSSLGVLAMTPMLAYLLSGHEAQIGKLMPLSEGPVILGMLVFLANVLRAWRTA